MRRKKRQLISEDFLLETAIGNRENGILEESLLRTTFCSSCAVHPHSVRPMTTLHTRLLTDPFEFNASNTWHEERQKRRLFRCLPSYEPCRESGRGSTDRALQSACRIFNNSEARPLNPSHAVNCSNSSDTRAPGMRFSSVWFLTGTDCTSGRRAGRSSCNGAVFLWERTARSSPNSCHLLHPSPSGRQRNGLAGHSQTSWTLGLDYRPRGSCCDPWRRPGPWSLPGVRCPSDQRPCA